MQRHLYLICYDIGCQRRWRQVHKLLSGYRVSGQKSVFECLLTGAELKRVVAGLAEAIEPREDRVHLVRLDPRMPCEGWGVAQPFRVGQALTVV